jgi:superfamily II DNA or RNA helicase
VADWSHQDYAVSETERALGDGWKRICVTGPTGSGKSRIVQRMLEWGKPSLVLCNRSMLLEQWGNGLDDRGLPFGMRASGYAPSIFDNVQLGMIQTIEKRWGNGREPLPDVELVFLDEAHNETGPRSCRILKEYNDRGVPTILVTATPVGIGHMADHLIVVAGTGELIRKKVLIPAQTFAPDEPDIRSMKKTTKGIIQFKDECKEVMLKVIFGRAIEHYRRLNPEHKPSILFAPGVDESRWLCEQFNDAGIPWSHIDSKLIILNGHEMKADRPNRERLMEASKTGETKGISNRFVLREGIDAPWLAHCIFACTFGSVTSYLQAGGRLLRSDPNNPDLTKVTIQDHGGNWWRHDSLNADREWSLEDTDESLQAKHDAEKREKKEAEPIVCPKCAKVRSKGVECPSCGFTARGKRRIVIQTDGTLREVQGDIYKPRRVNDSPKAHKDWKATYYQFKNAGKTFSQARGYYLYKTGGVPAPDCPLTPRFDSDWALPINQVPYGRLVPMPPRGDA